MSKNKYSQHRSLFSKPAPAVPSAPKRKWVVLPVMWKAAKRTAMVLGFMVLLSSLVSVCFLGSVIGDAVPYVPSKAALYIEFEGNLVDNAPNSGFVGPFSPPAQTLRQVVEAIDHARYDDRIQGIIVRLKDGGMSSANAREIRDVLQEFKSTGKFLRVYATAYGGLSGGLGQYYLASMFDEIWMQPMGVVSIPGIQAEIPYFRDVLDKIGIEPQFFQRNEYKTAYESAQRSSMSAPNREMLKALIGDVQSELVAQIAKDRGMSVPEFNALLDLSLFTAEEALKVGLITVNDYADSLVDMLRIELTGDLDNDDDILVGLEDYLSDIDMHFSTKKGVFPTRKKWGKVALIYVSGAIMTSGNGGEMAVAASEDIVPAIMDATDDVEIGAIVLRVDSPGGSPVASESILRALDLAQKEGVIVVISMGSVAASGGYWVASHADQIFALPTTITGSIGVIGGKPSLQEFWKKAGVNWDRSVKWGENSGMWSFNTPFSESEAERFNMMLDHTYTSFLERVAEGRNMSVGDVDKIAGGRVWSGLKAREIGLVDQLGGLNDALDYAALSLKLRDRYDLDVVVMPEPKTPMEQLVELLNGEIAVGDLPSVSAFARFMAWVKPLLVQVDMMVNAQDYAVYESLSVR